MSDPKYTSINITGDSSLSGAIDINVARTINWYPILGNPDARGVQPIYLYPTEGSDLFNQLDGDIVRGCVESNNIGYYVVSTKFYEIDSSGTRTERGTLSTTSGRVRFALINDLILLVDGAAGWLYTISTSNFTQVVDVDFPAGAVDVSSMDGYFIVPQPDTQKFYISTDGATWAATDFTNVLMEGDSIIACRAFLDELWVFGESFSQQYYNSGNIDFPFEPQRGLRIGYGCQSIDSIAKTTDSLVWLGKSDRGSVVPVRLLNSQVVPIFNKGILKEIDELTITNDAVAFVYQRGHHEFYVLTFPSEDKTYVFDLSEGMSHERQSKNNISGEYGRWFPECYMNIAGHHICGDFQTGNLYELSSESFDEAGTAIRRVRRTSVFETGNLTTIWNLKLRFETDQSLSSGQGSDPLVMVRISRDGGHTFDSEILSSVGTSGEFRDIVTFPMLGQAYKWCLEFAVTDPINWKVIKGYAQIEEGEF